MEEEITKQPPRWLPADVEAVREGLSNGHSAATIAKVVKKSRNAVIGYIFRHFRTHPKRETKEKILARASEKRKAKGIDNVVRKPRNLPRPASFGKPYEEPPRPIIPVTMFDKRGGTRLLDARRNQCRHILTKERGDYNPLICGKQTQGVTSWCLDHQSLVYVKKGVEQ